MSRLSWDAYFMGIAYKAKERATCDRAHVGCVIVVGRDVVATGYNGSPPGEPHCDEEGHVIEDGHCVRTTHAEINALARAAKRGVRVADGRAYVTHRPCLTCLKALVTAGVKLVIYGTAYGPGYPAALARWAEKYAWPMTAEMW